MNLEIYTHVFLVPGERRVTEETREEADARASLEVNFAANQ